MSDWWKKAIVYQIYPQSFKDTNGDGIGDIPGIIEKLDYIKKLGANTIWLTPIFKSPLVDNGYDISDYEAINPMYGTMEDMDELIKKAHSMKIRIIFDLVVNHTSDKHKWFQESKKSKDNPYSDYYIWEDPKPDGSAPSNLGSSFGGAAWTYVPERKQYYLHLFTPQQPDLNWENPKMRQDIYKMMRFWLNKGIDGFRMDSISLISKERPFKDVPVEDNKKFGAYHYGTANGPHIHDYLQEMNKEVLSKYDVLTVGETPRTSKKQALLYVTPSRHELNMIFQFDHMHVDNGPYGHYSDITYKMSDLRSSMAGWDKAVPWNALYLGNHDQPRIVSRFGDDKQFRYESATTLAMLQFLQRGTPYMFEGDELGMTNVDFKDMSELKDLEAHNSYKFLRSCGFSKEKAFKWIKRTTRDNARTPMQWDASHNAGFSNCQPWIRVNDNYKEINVQNSLSTSKSVFRFYQKLIDLKLNNEVAIDGDFDLINADDSAVFSYIRTLGNKKLLVIGSLYNKKVKYNLPQNFQFKNSKLVLSNYDRKDLKLHNILYLEPYEGLTYILND